MSGWRERTPREGEALGLGFARYKNNGAWCAAVAQVEALREIRVRRVWLAVDVGRVVQEDGVRNQLEGGAIQTVSWCLKESVQFDHTQVTSDTWSSYPILRFSEVLEVEVALIDRPQEPSLGAGGAHPRSAGRGDRECTGRSRGRALREMPFTWDRVQRAASAA